MQAVQKPPPLFIWPQVPFSEAAVFSTLIYSRTKVYGYRLLSFFCTQNLCMASLLPL